MLDNRYKALMILNDTHSYTQTAKQLFITQPAVSQQIKSLEQELEIPLIDRKYRQIRLTPVGITLAIFAKQTMLESNKLLAAARQQQRPLRIGCTQSLSLTLLPTFLGLLAKTTPNLVVTTNNTAQILESIRNGLVDFGLVEGNFSSQEFDSLFLMQDNLVAVTANNRLLAPIQSIKQLFKETLIVREPGSGSREIFENWLSTQNFQLNNFKQSIELSSPASIIKLLKQDIGISFLYESLVETELKEKQLKKITVPALQISHPINLVYLHNSYFAADYRRLGLTLLNQRHHN